MNNRQFGEQSMPAPNFSWSIARHELFAFCECAYFYHYYGAVGGAERYASAAASQIYRLKKLMPGQLWLAGLFSRSLRQTLLAASIPLAVEAMLKELFRLLSRDFHRGRQAVETAAWKNDPGQLNLQELYYGETRAEQYFATLWSALESRLQIFSGSGLPALLSSVGPLNWKREPIPVSFAFNGLQLWTAPDLLWQDGDCVAALCLSGGKTEAKRNLIATLNVIFISEAFKLSPARIIHLFFNLATGEIEQHGLEQLNLSSALDEISISAAKMLAQIAPDGTVTAATFAQNHNHCAYCRFREFCRDNAAARQ